MSIGDNMDSKHAPTGCPNGRGDALAQLERQLIYVVDDEKAVGDIIALLFQLQGFQTCLFEKPELALKAFVQAKPRPGLLVTDYVMHPINGMELIAQCLIIEPGLKTILISGNVGEDVLHRHAAQPDAFIRKPFVPKILMTTAHKLLSLPFQERKG